MKKTNNDEKLSTLEKHSEQTDSEETLEDIYGDFSLGAPEEFESKDFEMGGMSM